jgi:hypothetical protein
MKIGYDAILDALGPEKLTTGEIEDKLGTLGLDLTLDEMLCHGILQWIPDGSLYARRKAPD